jgi:hypothetical protein
VAIIGQVWARFNRLSTSRLTLFQSWLPNCKVAIMGSRSWIVAKASPLADVILHALARGVKILRDNGTIARAYQESGFFNPRVADWKGLF